MLRRGSLRRKSFRKSDISRPSNFQHRIHADHDPQTGDIRGLPLQWKAFLGPESIVRAGQANGPKRPRPVVDPSCITPADMARMKRIVRGESEPPPSTTSYVADRQHPFSVMRQDGSRRADDRVAVNGQLLGDDEFFTTLRSLVSPLDPRPHLRHFDKLAEGSTGAVFTALAVSTGRRMVVKCMNVWRQQRRELLFNEVLVMRECGRHPNLVDVYGAYLVGGDELWVTMEWMDGGSLTQIVTRHRMSELQIATVVEQCLRGLAHLHSRGIIHRDIKSDSILLSSDGRVKLSDFGFCGRLTAECPRRRSLLGTPYWFSPIVAARLPYGCDADIWSMGITVMEMVFGEPPHFDDPITVAMRKIVDMPAPRFPPSANVSPELDSFVSLMLVKEPRLQANAVQLLRYPFIAGKTTSLSCLAPLISACQAAANGESKL